MTPNFEDLQQKFQRQLSLCGG